MKTAIRYLKNDIATVPLTLTDDQAKLQLIESIDTFILQRITVPMNFIGEEILAKEKIVDGDVILTFGTYSFFYLYFYFLDLQRCKVYFKLLLNIL